MSAKDDVLRQIEASIQRKKILAKEVSREKTIVQWVCEFFSEVEKTKNIDDQGNFASLALSKLIINLRTLDKKCSAVFKEPKFGNDPQVEIYWSKKYILDNNCEHVMTLDASSAFFQNAIERHE